MDEAEMLSRRGGECDVSVLIVDLSILFGGASSRALGLLRGLSPAPSALAALKGSPAAAAAAAAGVTVHEVAAAKTDPRIPRRLAALIEEKGYRVLDSQNPQSKMWCAAAVRQAPAALVSTLNSWYLSEHGRSVRGVLYHQLERLSTGRTDIFIAVSGEIEGKLLDAGVARERVRMIPNAVDFDPREVDADGEALRGEFAIPGGSHVCCSVGRMVEVKGHRTLLEGIAREGLDGVHTVFVGDGPLRHKLEKRAEELGLAGRVHFTGYRDRNQVLKIVGSSDLFVLPSCSEGTPMALLEAAALGRPIVASGVGGIPEILRDGEHALLVEPGDAGALGRALGEVFRDPSRAAAMAARARDHVLERFGIGGQVAATREAYGAALELLSRRGG
jgi:glycosyltransferase involved in cell wall biosynthesis